MESPADFAFPTAPAPSAAGPCKIVFVGLGNKDLTDQLAALREAATAIGPKASAAILLPDIPLSAGLAASLNRNGFQDIHVAVHAAQADAHDWLVQAPGALRRTLRNIKTAADAGLRLTAEVVPTRPTLALLPETVDLLTRAGVQAVAVRRLCRSQVSSVEYAALAPRHAQLAPPFERAAENALRRRLPISFRGFPPCSAPRLAPLFAPTGRDLHWNTEDQQLRSSPFAGAGCSSCHLDATCSGAPADYVDRFGWEEFLAAPTGSPRTEDAPEASVLTLSWQGPSRIQCAGCADHTTSSVDPEPSRRIRARLVQAANLRPRVARLVGAEVLAHPEAASLLFDVVRLFPHVEVAGEAAQLAGWSDVELRRLSDLRRIDFALYGATAASHDAHSGITGSFAATLQAVERIRTTLEIPVGLYAIVHDAEQIREFAHAWENASLPGAPRFRIAVEVQRAAELHELAAQLEFAPAREALLTALAQKPDQAAWRSFSAGRSAPYLPCGSDPDGSFPPCNPPPDRAIGHTIDS